ncbi:uncharacterized protein STEHIDRAFT_111624 [Stereum hirsutum FP-91666 SS1]|uniref:uncharacterized protein n=1 Tax=Stereum hirsutum (strain FP-91666) TaxID=721885 RepID=UPI0004449395|nr:uncharacterized protein STEHIDRAFT_111624 [Stereum hirsutum FP-91666 SS1]EIM86083.1 hypothetical protein STEHIDRAFT_111624 [Stereum hirsutum FP-91666 SS1]
MYGGKYSKAAKACKLKRLGRLSLKVMHHPKLVLKLEPDFNGLATHARLAYDVQIFLGWWTCLIPAVDEATITSLLRSSHDGQPLSWLCKRCKKRSDGDHGSVSINSAQSNANMTNTSTTTPGPSRNSDPPIELSDDDIMEIDGPSTSTSMNQPSRTKSPTKSPTKPPLSSSKRNTPSIAPPPETITISSGSEADSDSDDIVEISSTPDPRPASVPAQSQSTTTRPSQSNGHAAAAAPNLKSSKPTSKTARSSGSTTSITPTPGPSTTTTIPARDSGRTAPSPSVSTSKPTPKQLIHPLPAKPELASNANASVPNAFKPYSRPANFPSSSTAGTSSESTRSSSHTNTTTSTNSQPRPRPPPRTKDHVPVASGSGSGTRNSSSTSAASSGGPVASSSQIPAQRQNRPGVSGDRRRIVRSNTDQNVNGINRPAVTPPRSRPQSAHMPTTTTTITSSSPTVVPDSTERPGPSTHNHKHQHKRTESTPDLHRNSMPPPPLPLPPSTSNKLLPNGNPDFRGILKAQAEAKARLAAKSGGALEEPPSDDYDTSVQSRARPVSRTGSTSTAEGKSRLKSASSLKPAPSSSRNNFAYRASSSSDIDIEISDSDKDADVDVDVDDDMIIDSDEDDHPKLQPPAHIQPAPPTPTSANATTTTTTTNANEDSDSDDDLYGNAPPRARSIPPEAWGTPPRRGFVARSFPSTNHPPPLPTPAPTPGPSANSNSRLPAKRAGPPLARNHHAQSHSRTLNQRPQPKPQTRPGSRPQTIQSLLCMHQSQTRENAVWERMNAANADSTRGAGQDQGPGRRLARKGRAKKLSKSDVVMREGNARDVGERQRAPGDRGRKRSGGRPGLCLRWAPSRFFCPSVLQASASFASNRSDASAIRTCSSRILISVLL